MTSWVLKGLKSSFLQACWWMTHPSPLNKTNIDSENQQWFLKDNEDQLAQTRCPNKCWKIQDHVNPCSINLEDCRDNWALDINIKYVCKFLVLCLHLINGTFLMSNLFVIDLLVLHLEWQCTREGPGTLDKGYC